MMDRKLRRGDVVTVRAVVKYDNGGSIHVALTGYTTATIERSDVMAFLQPKVEEGDYVRLSDDRSEGGKVLAVAESGGKTFLSVERNPGDVVMWDALGVVVDEDFREVEPPPMPPAKND